jgi:hypothetical protein
MDAGIHLQKLRMRITAACSLIVACFPIMFLFFRVGLPDLFVSEIVICAGLSLFLLFTPLVVGERVRFSRDEVRDELIILAVLLGLMLIPVLRFTMPVFVLAGYGSFFFAIGRLFKGITVNRHFLGWAFALLLFAVWIVLTCFLVGRPTILESVTFNRDLVGAHDLFYHTAVAQMIKNYSVGSTGLQGTPPIFYHYGSHFLFARFAEFTSIHVIKIYTIFYPLVVISLFFKYFSYFVILLQRYLTNISSFTFFQFLLLVFLFVGIPHHDYSGGFFQQSILSFESTMVSYLILCILLSVVLTFCIEGSFEGTEVNILLFVIIPAMLWIIGFCKVSTLFVMLAVFLSVFFCAPRTKLFWSLVLSSAGSAMVFFFSVETLPFGIRSGGMEGELSLFSFYRTLSVVDLFHPLDWFVLYLLWTYAAVCVYGLMRYRIAFFNITMEKFSLLTLCAIAASLAGLLPSVFFAFFNANAAFFLSPQLYLAGALIIAIFPELLARIKTSAVLIRHAVIGVIALGSLTAVAKINLLAYNLVSENVLLNLRMTGVEPSTNKFALAAYLEWFEKKVSLQTLPAKQAKLLTVFKKLEDVDRKAPQNGRSNTLIVVQDYENGKVIPGTEKLNCAEKAFMIPALTGYAAANGALYNCSVENFGAHYYEHPAIDADFSPSTMCVRAKKNGFSSLLLFHSSGRIIIHDCR